MKAIGFIFIFVSGFLISFDLISHGYMSMDSLASHENDLYIDAAILIAGLIYSTQKKA